MFAMTLGCMEMDHLGIVKRQLNSLKDNEVSTNRTPFVTVLDLQRPLSRCIQHSQQSSRSIKEDFSVYSNTYVVVSTFKPAPMLELMMGNGG